jgi:hypothetical protein
MFHSFNFDSGTDAVKINIRTNDHNELIGETTLKISPVIIVTFVLGVMLGTTFSALAANNENSIDSHVFGRAEAFLAAMHNIVISLSVDTERSAINIAEMDKRMAKLESRVADLEKAGNN